MNQEEAYEGKSVSMTGPEWEIIENYAKARGMSRSMAIRFLCLYAPEGLVTSKAYLVEPGDTKEGSKAA